MNENKFIVKNEIIKKIGNCPYIPNLNITREIKTDMDHFPYTRWYRGVYNSDKPIIMDREAGWQIIDNDKYITLSNEKDEKPNHCFQAPCSTIYPCFNTKSRNTDYDIMNGNLITLYR